MDIYTQYCTPYIFQLLRAFRKMPYMWQGLSSGEVPTIVPTSIIAKDIFVKKTRPLFRQIFSFHTIVLHTSFYVKWKMYIHTYVLYIYFSNTYEATFQAKIYSKNEIIIFIRHANKFFFIQTPEKKVRNFCLRFVGGILPI